MSQTNCSQEIKLATNQYNITPDIEQQYENNLKFLLKDAPSPTTPYPLEFLAENLLKAQTPLLYGSDVTLKRQEIRSYFHHTFTMFERLHDVLLNDATFYYQPERLRHPLVFYFGHTAVFFLNKLNIAGVIKQRIDPSIESMCAIGVDEMSWDDLNPSHYHWPSIDRLREYRSQVRTLIDTLIQTLPLTLPINWESPFWIILMGIEHERIHLETSSVLFRQLPPHCVKQTTLLQLFPHSSTPEDKVQQNKQQLNDLNSKLIETNSHKVNNIDITQETTYELSPLPSLNEVRQDINNKDGGYIEYSDELYQIANDITARSFTTKPIPSRTVLFGKSYSHHLYGWDNEYGQDQQNIPTFQCATKLITNKQYLFFILNGGYYNESYWTEEGWKFAQYKTNVLRQPWPVFWFPQADELKDIEYPSPTPAILEELPQTPSTPKVSQSNDTDGYVVLNSDDISGSETEDGTIKKSFNSTMRVHNLKYPSHLTIQTYKYRWLSGLIDMPWDWPVDINNLESQAYSKFVQEMVSKQQDLTTLLQNTTNLINNDSGLQSICRLPTEFEYKSMQLHILSTYGQMTRSEPIQNDTTQPFNYNPYDYPFAAKELNQNISLTHASSSPVDYYQYYNSGFYDVIGNVWQHCCSVTYPLKDFKVHPAYDDFTVPTFDNMHGIIVGGSWIGTGNEACFNARYAFRRHFYQHAGARIGFFTNKPKTGEELQSIEQDITISNRLHADFYDLLPNQDLIQCETPNNKSLLCTRDVNSKQTAQLVYDTICKLQKNNDLTPEFNPHKIMVLGCRGGRLPIELGILYPDAKIQGIDTTVRLLGAGLRLMENLQVSYLLKTSYEQTTFVRIREGAFQEYLIQQGITQPDEYLYKRIDLMQTDVCNLPEDKVGYNAYNTIIVDCLDTAYNPKLLLENLHRHLVSNATNSTQQSVVALNIYHQWEQCDKDAVSKIWGYRDESNGEFVDIERGIANIVPNSWKLAFKSDFNQRVRRINERILSLYDMTTYFYVVTPSTQ